MESKPQPFSWPGLAEAPGGTKNQSEAQIDDPAQVAADAATAGHQQGFDRGYAEGLAKGEQEAALQAAQKITKLDLVFEEAEAFARQWRAAQVELVQLISAKYFLRELATDSEQLAQLLAQGQQLLPTSEDFILACHPDVAAMLGKQSQYTLVEDAQLPPESLELRQGYSCLQLNLNAVVEQAFANLDQILDLPVEAGLKPAESMLASDSESEL